MDHSERGFHRVQGLLALTDNTETSGGFHCVPGFHKHFDEWSKSTKAPKVLEYPINVPVEDPLRHFVEKITLQAGSFLIWDSRLPHGIDFLVCLFLNSFIVFEPGNFPNHDNTFRMVQYIRMEPSKEQSEMEVRMRYAMAHPTYAEPVNFTPLGEKLVGRRNWEDDSLNQFWFVLEEGLEM